MTATDTTSATGSTDVHLDDQRRRRRRLLSPGQKLGNPGFETGTAAPWTASAGVIDSSAGEPAHSGTWKAWLDGYGTTHTDTLSQSVTIPAGLRARRSRSGCTSTPRRRHTTAYDKLTVKAGATTLATYSNLNKASGYTPEVVQPVVVRGPDRDDLVQRHGGLSLQTSFVVDDTALTAS